MEAEGRGAWAVGKHQAVFDPHSVIKDINFHSVELLKVLAVTCPLKAQSVVGS